MANHATKTEHAGAKNSMRKSGYWGLRADAKHESNKARRGADKKEASNADPDATR